MREMRNIYELPRRKSERKSPLGRPSVIWEDNIKMVLKRFGFECMSLSHLTEDSIEM
jgi:hypothetical protein